MKKQNAFALRGFDKERILQRPFFKDLNPLDDSDDEAILLGFWNVWEKPIKGITQSGYLKVIKPTDDKYFSGMLENLDVINRLAVRALRYEKHIERHMIKLHEMQKGFVEVFMVTEGKNYKEKIIRTTTLLKCYREALDSASALRREIMLQVPMLKKLFEKDFRQYVFGSRLREKRQELGLTQEQLALRVGFKTYNSIAQYERGINDPSMPTLFRIATELNCSADWLLNLK